MCVCCVTARARDMCRQRNGSKEMKYANKKAYRQPFLIIAIKVTYLWQVVVCLSSSAFSARFFAPILSYCVSQMCFFFFDHSHTSLFFYSIVFVLYGISYNTGVRTYSTSNSLYSCAYLQVCNGHIWISVFDCQTLYTHITCRAITSGVESEQEKRHEQQLFTCYANL